MANLKKIFDDHTVSNIIPKKYLREDSYNFSRLAKAQTDSLIHDITVKDKIRSLIGKEKKYKETIGTHPDFLYLNGDETEYHHITSVFCDIKGSTKLAKELTLDEVKFVKNATLITVIDIFQALDGHIHRLQGDAVFAFFGRKDMKKATSIVDALNAASILQYYFTKYVIPKFEELGLPAVKLRIGIDFGNDDEVMWSSYGIKETNEITTTSLHTDLSAKMQNKAKSSGIIFGDNIVNFLDFPDEFYKKKTYVEDGITKYDEYAIQYKGYKYRMWDFQWEKYLEKLPLLDENNGITFKCYTMDESNNYEIYSNCTVLSKNIDLRFELDINKTIDYDTIKWDVKNRGKEASEDQESLNFEMTTYKNRKYCEQKTAYIGHHYMVCTIMNQGREIYKKHFGIYIDGE